LQVLDSEEHIVHFCSKSLVAMSWRCSLFMCSSLSRTCKRFHTIDIATQTPRKLERTLSQKCNDDPFKTIGSRMVGDRTIEDEAVLHSMTCRFSEENY
jgi:hypothetical protein